MAVTIDRRLRRGVEIVLAVLRRWFAAEIAYGRAKAFTLTVGATWHRAVLRQNDHIM